jgi:hypothetical protein
VCISTNGEKDVAYFTVTSQLEDRAGETGDEEAFNSLVSYLGNEELHNLHSSQGDQVMQDENEALEGGYKRT